LLEYPAEPSNIHFSVWFLRRSRLNWHKWNLIS
jgi:hypothetical protein